MQSTCASGTCSTCASKPIRRSEHNVMLRLTMAAEIAVGIERDDLGLDQGVFFRQPCHDFRNDGHGQGKGRKYANLAEGVVAEPACHGPQLIEGGKDLIDAPVEP